MKLKSGQIIPNSDIQKIVEAADATKGTDDYTKYWMEMYTSIADSWAFVGHGVPRTSLPAKIKQYKDRVYLVFEYPSAGRDRYEITDAVMTLMGWEV